MRPSDTIHRPDFDIPDLTPQQQEAMSLPADFWAAFDLYFADSLDPAGPAGDWQVAYEHLMGLAGDRAAFAGSWRVDHIDAERVEVTGATGVWTSFTEPEIVSAVEAVLDAEERSARAQLLSSIRRGKPVWSFLPVRRDRQRQVHKFCQSRLALTRIERQAPGSAEAAELRGELDQLGALIRWPGDDLPTETDLRGEHHATA